MLIQRKEPDNIRAVIDRMISDSIFGEMAGVKEPVIGFDGMIQATTAFNPEYKVPTLEEMAQKVDELKAQFEGAPASCKMMSFTWDKVKSQLKKKDSQGIPWGEWSFPVYIDESVPVGEIRVLDNKGVVIQTFHI